MPVFTVHAPVDAVRRADSDRFVFVRDGFHFWAFLFGPLWFVWHRLWLALVAYLVIIAGVAGLMVGLRTGADAQGIVVLIVALLTGYEAANARRWTLSRGWWRELGVVVADDAESAERRFFAQWTGEHMTAAPSPDRAPRPARSGANHDVIGLFPQPGVPR
jgi:Protein of unknown function (DUF2628)